MGSLYSSINTGLSAMRYQQSVLDIASTNVANATTEGYVRRRIVGQTVGAAAAPAVWSRSNEIGSGVQAQGVERFSDALLDIRVRREHGRQSFLDAKATALSRVETGINEPSNNGVAAAISKFRNSLHDLVNSPGSDAARSQVLASASIVADAFNIQVRNIADETGDQQAHLAANVKEINDVAAQLADTNATISGSSVAGGDVASLMDTRDRLALRLSELTGATASQRADGGLDVALNGVTLVDGSKASSVAVTGSGPTVLTVTHPDATTGTVAGTAVGGEAGAAIELIDVDLPAYDLGLKTLMSQFATDINTAHKGGYDKAGVAGGDLFKYDPADPAGPLTVVITDVAKLAASSIGPGAPNLDATNADKVADAIKIDDAYQQLVNGFGSDVASVKRLATNQQAMTSQVDGAHDQLAGVSTDEETVNMVMAQRSYEAAARVLTTVDQMLDTLINRTGLVGR